MYNVATRHLCISLPTLQLYIICISRHILYMGVTKGREKRNVSIEREKSKDFCVSYIYYSIFY